MSQNKFMEEYRKCPKVLNFDRSFNNLLDITESKTFFPFVSRKNKESWVCDIETIRDAFSSSRRGEIDFETPFKAFYDKHKTSLDKLIFVSDDVLEDEFFNLEEGTVVDAENKLKFIVDDEEFYFDIKNMYMRGIDVYEKFPDDEASQFLPALIIYYFYNCIGNVVETEHINKNISAVKKVIDSMSLNNQIVVSSGGGSSDDSVPPILNNLASSLGANLDGLGALFSTGMSVLNNVKNDIDIQEGDDPNIFMNKLSEVLKNPNVQSQVMDAVNSLGHIYKNNEDVLKNVMNPGK